MKSRLPDRRWHSGWTPMMDGNVEAPIAEVGWFDPTRKQFKAITRHEPLEVLTLSGAVALGADANPIVHAHMVVGDSEGNARGGHLLSAIASPTLEVYVTCFPQPLHSSSIRKPNCS
jgi:predicted DNA-binding protein with PD1-like motif